MSHFKETLDTHPTPESFDKEKIAEVVEKILDCAMVCVSCADACLSESNVDQLKRCIRLDQDCADICFTAGKILLRQSEGDWSLLRAQLELCCLVCKSCEKECRLHADRHAHCRVCADACQTCADICERTLENFPVAA